MFRNSIALVLRVFFALVIIGLIGREITYEAAPVALGPKFVSPGDKPGQQANADDELNIFELALEAAQDLLGPTPEPEPRSSLQQLDQRNRISR
ncbi:hypothetical protein BCF46_3804 [Litoreibacter meonggei]|uniref:Uncharacterized protein n=1 Tax=Litoreibacter meonggei TaxID=1049199 RepID=A0A497VAR7_9RHOB|nr:hypothetical protein [Litoreibacter meonggei]RLJ36336.1 hypothetical protein BCF46_3804 [Litoreibacter meonggei]